MPSGSGHQAVTKDRPDLQILTVYLERLQISLYTNTQYAFRKSTLVLGVLPHLTLVYSGRRNPPHGHARHKKCNLFREASLLANTNGRKT